MIRIIPYALVIAGIPLFFGLLLGSMVSLPIARFIMRSSNPNTGLVDCLEAFNGFGAAFTAAVVFRIFLLTPSLGVPLIIAAQFSFYFWRYKQSRRAWASSMTGLLVGWFIVVPLMKG